MTEFALNNLWLIPVLPLVAAVLIAVFGRAIKPMAHVPAWLAMAGSMVLALTVLFAMKADPTLAGRLNNQESVKHIFTWFSAGNLVVPVGILFDHLTAVYLSFVTGVGFLIFVYAAGYMKGDYSYWRFFAYFSLFVFFMCALVMGNNFILLYLGWEGVGLASYLLIGYYYPRPSAVAAAKKAFITNRIGDFGLAIGVFLIYKTFGTIEYAPVFDAVRHGHLTADQELAVYWIPFCLMLGAFGKSAQFPLHVWLPDAMEGPTPVSALIHAATMVTAGIYLIARCMPLFVGNADALNTVACIGGFTAFLAASIALCQNDLKRVWAYSTLSQLGYMFLGLGVMANSSAVFHVFTHSWFKALLFLSAGSVMHAMGGELDLRKMSGVRKVMPITHITMLIGCLALAGVPGLAGFFSKDEIIHHVLNHPGPLGLLLGILALVVAFMTAYYTFRLFFRVFWGPLVLPATAGHHEPSPFALEEHHENSESRIQNSEGHGAAHEHGEHEHAGHGPNDGSPVMWLPLVVLAAGAVGAGYLGTTWFGLPDFMHNFLAPVFGGGHGGEGAAVEHAERVSDGTMVILSSAIAVAGIAVAAYFHWLNRHAATIVGANCKPLVKFLENRWYIDHIYWTFITMGAWFLGKVLAFFDQWGVDLAVNVVGSLPSVVGQIIKPTQRGMLQRYALGMVAGITVIVVGVLYFINR